MGFFAKLDRAYGKYLNLSAIFSTGAICLVMFAYAIDCITRWCNMPIHGIFELSNVAAGMGICMGLAFCQREKQHINVTILHNALPVKGRLILDACIYVVSIVFFSWMVVQYISFTILAIQQGATIEGIVRFPLWPLKSVMALGLLMLDVQYVIDLIKTIYTFAHPEPEESAEIAAAEGTEVQA